MKRYVAMTIVFSFILLIVSPIALYLHLPMRDLNRLKDHYVEVIVQEEGARFQIVKKRPVQWRNLDHISQVARRAIIISEDWAFFEHEGYDLSEIQNAIAEKFVEGKRLRGASTITQQVVKNVLVGDERSLMRKLKELLMAILIEQKLGKKRILEIYLNIVHLGPDLYGVPNASRYYFNKSASELNAREGAFLAMCLPSPVRYSQSFRQKELTSYAVQTMNQILDKMVIAKYLSKEEAEKEKLEKFNWEQKDQETTTNQQFSWPWNE